MKLLFLGGPTAKWLIKFLMLTSNMSRSKFDVYSYKKWNWGNGKIWPKVPLVIPSSGFSLFIHMDYFDFEEIL